MGATRECFVPRPGWVYISSDYDTIELRALAQVCIDLLGKSEMAKALRNGEDLHFSLAADMLGISYEEAMQRKKAGDNEIAEYRQLAKIQNFGLPGGLSAPTFVGYAEGFGVTVTLERAQWLKDSWFKRWPEMRDYFTLVSATAETEAPITQIRSGRVRGGATYCAIANGWFQGLAADLAKDALWQVSKECYLKGAGPDGNDSPLFGCRPVMYVHDEIVAECARDSIGPLRASQAADRLSEVMISVKGRWMPDVPVTCKPVMTKRLYKGAEQVRIDGVLVPSKPVSVVAVDGKKRTQWVADLS